MKKDIQFDSSETVVGGVNIAASIQVEQKIYFNESYTVLGNNLKAPVVYANYDLNVIGDFEAETIVVQGALNVVGNIKAKNLSCYKTLVCSGDINAETINSTEVIANNITCKDLYCSGNVIVRGDIDADKSIIAEKCILSGEGIIGNGHFSSDNAVAVEYFDFDGDIKGNVLELESRKTFGEEQSQTPTKIITLEELLDEFKQQVGKDLLEAGKVDEDSLAECIKRVASFDETYLSDWDYLAGNIVDISYYDEITNLRDYLIVVMAKKVLPKEITEYETLEHVFSKLLPDVEEKIDEISFHAKDVKDLAYSIEIVFICKNELKMNQDDLLDKIFQSIGIKYNTVQKFLK